MLVINFVALFFTVFQPCYALSQPSFLFWERVSSSLGGAAFRRAYTTEPTYPPSKANRYVVVFSLWHTAQVTPHIRLSNRGR